MEPTDPATPQPFTVAIVVTPAEGSWWDVILIGGGGRVTIAERLTDPEAALVTLAGALSDLLSVPDRLRELQEEITDLSPKVQELIDVQGTHDENAEILDRRLQHVEATLVALQRKLPAVTMRPQVPRATRQPYVVQRQDPDDLGDGVDLDQVVPSRPAQLTHRPAQAPPTAGQRLTRRTTDPTPGRPAAAPPADRNSIAYEGHRPEFDRATMVPHQPVGGVTRGPGSEG